MELVVAQTPRPAPKLAWLRAARPAMLLLLSSVTIFGAAFAVRRAFLWGIKPVSWEDTPPQNGALEAAFLLLSIENVAAIVAAIAVVFVAVSWWRSRRQDRERQQDRQQQER